MALEMKVYGEIRAYEAKVISGLSWRQLLTLIVATPIIAGISVLLWFHGRSWIAATDMFVFAPFAAYGWWRPRGLKPESYVRYLLNSAFAPKELIYDPHASVAAQATRTPGRSRAVHRTAFALEHGYALSPEEQEVFHEEPEEVEAQEGSGQHSSEFASV